MASKKRPTVTVSLDFTCRICGATPNEALLSGRRGLVHECWDSHACRKRRDAAVWAASRAGSTVEELGERFDLRREKITQILSVQRAHAEAAPNGGSADGSR